MKSYKINGIVFTYHFNDNNNLILKGINKDTIINYFTEIEPSEIAKNSIVKKIGTLYDVLGKCFDSYNNSNNNSNNIDNMYKMTIIYNKQKNEIEIELTVGLCDSLDIMKFTLKRITNITDNNELNNRLEIANDKIRKLEKKIKKLSLLKNDFDEFISYTDIRYKMINNSIGDNYTLYSIQYRVNTLSVHIYKKEWDNMTVDLMPFKYFKNLEVLRFGYKYDISIKKQNNELFNFDKMYNVLNIHSIYNLPLKELYLSGIRINDDELLDLINNSVWKNTLIILGIVNNPIKNLDPIIELLPKLEYIDYDMTEVEIEEEDFLKKYPHISISPK